jgi:hypothetical protein
MQYFGRFSVRTSILVACVLVPASGTPAQSVAPGASQRSKQTCTVSGKIVMAGKPAPGVTVVVSVQDDRNPVANHSPVARTRTDEAGHYRLTGLAAGEYYVTPFAPLFVPATSTPRQDMKSIRLNEGETADGLDFEMVLGGVITGAVTGADGQPLIDEVVVIYTTDDGQVIPAGRGADRTDDRGVYRIYGLPPGKYRVVVSRGRFHETYSPGVTDRARATLVEVESGAETTADIAVSAALKRYFAGGRAIDSDTNKPAPNVSYGFSCLEGEEKGLFGGGDSTHSNGVFGIDDLAPGRYCVLVNHSSNYYCDPFFFEVTDQDLTGLELRLHRGAVVAGSAVIEGVQRAEVLSKLQNLSLTASNQASDQSYSMRAENVRLESDGSFRIGGLQPGQLRLDLIDSENPEFSIARVEVNGVNHRTDGITVLEGAQINGVRLVIAYNSGRIRGQLEIPTTLAGALPPRTLIYIFAELVSDDGEVFRRESRVSAGGKFEISGLMDGEYKLTLFPGTMQWWKVTVTNGQAPFTVIDLGSSPQR